MQADRQAPLDTARLAARYTIPALIPPEGLSEGQRLPQPYQGQGARAVNTLSSKTTLALFPPNTAFFRLEPDPEIDDGLDDEVRADVTDGLAKVERTVISQLEATKIRATLSTAIKHLLVGGNGVVHCSDKLKFRFFSLERYCVERDAEGTVVLLVIREMMSPRRVPSDVLEAVYPDEEERMELLKKTDASIDIYTVMELQPGGKRYRYYQEINDNEVPKSAGTSPVDSPPFIVLRWTAVENEDYGRGMVSEYLGDFSAMENFSRDLQKASAAAAKTIYLLNPNSVLKAKQLASAESLAVLYGRKDDVSTVGLEKFADFRFAQEMLDRVTRQVQEAFLMHSSIQRDAERVTAEEIRYMAQELEDALGGVYSLLAEELQRPLVQRVMNVLIKQRKIPDLPKDDIDTRITTGLEALGRGHELNKLRALISDGGTLLGDQFVTRLNGEEVSNRLAQGYGVDDTDLFRNNEEIQAEQDRERMAQALQDAAPGVLQQAAGPQPQ